MGNCIERCRNSPQRRDGGIKTTTDGEVQESTDSSKMRIRIVLTKDELEWLMTEVKRRHGTRLEDVLVEIQRNRKKSAATAAWKPCLESIVETPELPDQMDM